MFLDYLIVLDLSVLDMQCLLYLVNVCGHVRDCVMEVYMCEKICVYPV